MGDMLAILEPRNSYIGSLHQLNKRYIGAASVLYTNYMGATHLLYGSFG